MMVRLAALLVALPLFVAAGTAGAQGKLEMFYLAAPDCPYCQHWESQTRDSFLASPESKAVKYVEIRGETLRRPIDRQHYPAEYLWVFEQVGPSRGVPRFLLAVDGKVVISAYGTGGFTDKFLPALREAIAKRQSMEKT